MADPRYGALAKTRIIQAAFKVATDGNSTYFTYTYK